MESHTQLHGLRVEIYQADRSLQWCRLFNKALGFLCYLYKHKAEPSEYLLFSSFEVYTDSPTTMGFTSTTGGTIAQPHS